MDKMLSTNQPIRLRDESGAEYASRVEAVDETSLSVARPLDLPASSELGEGSRLELRWTSDSGVLRVAVDVLSTTTDGRVRLWHVQPVGQVARDQRRSHVRVVVERTAILRREDGSTQNCLLVDVSEAAVRCRLERPKKTDEATDEPPTPRQGEQVEISFALADDVFANRATVYRASPIDGGVELVLMLDVDERGATRLRRVLFAEQVRLRSLFRD